MAHAKRQARTIAHWVSDVFAPPVTLFFGFLLAIRFSEAPGIEIFGVIVTVGVFPLLALVLARRRGIISDFNVTKKSERRFPLMITTVSALVALSVGLHLHWDHRVIYFALGHTITSGLILLVTESTEFKVSVHVAGASALLCILFRTGDFYAQHFAMLAFVVMPVARVSLKAHRLSEVLLGHWCGVAGFAVAPFILQHLS